jgi:hypothetical protein
VFALIGVLISSFAFSEGRGLCSGNDISIKQCLIELKNEVLTLKNKDSLKSFTIDGEPKKFYPVLFRDSCWNEGETHLVISRSNVHLNGDWSGSFNARFTYHSFNNGHGSGYIDVAIEQTSEKRGPFIADFKDPSSSGIVVWLRGGGLTYNYKSSCADTTLVFDVTKIITISPNGGSAASIDQVQSKIDSIIGTGWLHY